MNLRRYPNRPQQTAITVLLTFATLTCASVTANGQNPLRTNNQVATTQAGSSLQPQALNAQAQINAQEIPPPTFEAIDPNVQQTSYAAPMLFNGGAPMDAMGGDISCDSCGMVGGGSCRACGLSRLWGSVEYLHWWEKKSRLPLLATTSEEGTIRDNAGVEGFATTSELFGNQTVADNPLSGMRFTLGIWGQGGDSGGLGFQYFALEKRTNEFNADSQTFPILGRPFFNVTLNEQDALLLGFPNLFAGNMQVRSISETEGGSVFLRSLARCGYNFRFDWLMGYRFMAVDEALSVDSTLQFLADDGLTPAGTVITQNDSFDFNNRFHGFDIGIMGHSRDGRWMMDLWARLALGNMNQDVDISGSTTTTIPAVISDTVNSGLLTQPSNIGNHQADRFAVIPEFTINLGYEISPRFDLWVGYTVLYVSRVARMGENLDRRVNLTQGGALVGEALPIYQIEETDFLLQGLNFGLNFEF